MTTRYGRAALRAECDKVKAAREGGREMALSLAAGHVGELVAGGEVSEHDALRELAYAAEMTGLRTREIAVTIAKGIKRGERNPRGARNPGGRYEPCHEPWRSLALAAEAEWDALPDSPYKRYHEAAARCRPCYESPGEGCPHEYEDGLASWA